MEGNNDSVHSDEIDLATIVPANYQLPATHVVQTLSGRYIHAAILTAVLDKKWPQNWQLVVSALSALLARRFPPSSFDILMCSRTVSALDTLPL